VEYVEIERTEPDAPTTTAPEPDEIEATAEREVPMIQPIPVYPAYIVDGATLWGVPASLQGGMHRERIEVALEDGTPAPGSARFFILGGYVYLAIEQPATDKTGPVIDYYRQAVGSKKVEIIEDMPAMPPEARIVLDCPAWLIETSTINGVEYSYLYNRAKVFGVDPPNDKGHFVCRRDRVLAFAMLDNGLLWQSEKGLEFCNSARKGPTEVGEGRLWK